MIGLRRIRPLDAVVACIVIAALVTIAARADLRGEQSPAPPTIATTDVDQDVDLSALRIDDTRPGPPGYSRELFGDWRALDGSRCDARQETLVAESLEPVVQEGCDVVAGRWHSPYDGVVVTDPSEVEVDHVVPLAEAWRAGAHAWSFERRVRFTNELGSADHLIAVSAAVNGSKGARPPDQWRPPEASSWCLYATAWLAVKVRWELSATTSERDALGEMLDTCAPA